MGPLLTSQVALTVFAMPRRRRVATAATMAATSALFIARGSVASEVRLYGVCAYVPCMYMHPNAS